MNGLTQFSKWPRPKTDSKHLDLYILEIRFRNLGFLTNVQSLYCTILGVPVFRCARPWQLATGSVLYGSHVWLSKWDYHGDRSVDDCGWIEKLTLQVCSAANRWSVRNATCQCTRYLNAQPSLNVGLCTGPSWGSTHRAISAQWAIWRKPRVWRSTTVAVKWYWKSIAFSSTFWPESVHHLILLFLFKRMPKGKIATYTNVALAE